MVSFLELVQDEEWEKAHKRLARVRTPKTAFEALKKCLGKQSVPPGLIRALICKMDEDPKLSEFFVFDATYMRGQSSENSNAYLWTSLCREASAETLREFLVALPGYYRTDRREEGSQHSFRPTNLCTAFNVIWGYTGSYDVGARIHHITGIQQSRTDALVSVSSLQDLEQYPDLQTMWKKTEMILMVGMDRKVYDSSKHVKDSAKDWPWLVLHAIAELSNDSSELSVICSKMIMWLALRLYPDQLRQRDRHGWLPLHYALKITLESSHYCFDGDLDECNKSMMELVLSHCPDAARYVDNQGRLPLHEALKNPILKSSPRRGTSLEAFVNAAPEAFLSRDIETGFFPYQLAALHGLPVEQIFILLSRNPAALKYRNLLPSELEHERLYDRLVKELGDVRKQNVELETRLNEQNEELRDLKEEIAVLKRKNEMDTADSDEMGRKRPRSSGK